MLKQIVAIIVLSIAIILAMPYAQHAVEFMIDVHDWVSQLLTEVFSGGQAGNLARGLIALLSVPVLIAFIPSLLFWIIKRHWFPYFMEIVWIVWLVQVGSLVVMYSSS